MSHAHASLSPRPVTDVGRLALTGAFFAFCYCLLTWRAHLLSDAAPLFSERRALALLVGAGVFWLSLGQIEKAGRLTLARIASWIVLGTIVVMVARLAVTWWKPDDGLTVTYSLRWSLAWAAYFGLWLMGAATFSKRAGLAESMAPATPAAAASSTEWEHVDWVVACLTSEIEGASAADRARLADKLICDAGTFEMVDENGDAAAHNARLRLAYRIAARLTAER